MTTLSEATVRQRIDAARRSGTPAWLWPEVQPEAWRRALREIERIVRALLEPDTAAVFDEAITADAGAFAVATYTSGTGPLLGHWVESGRLCASEPVRELLALHLAHGRARMKSMTAITDVLLSDAERMGAQLTILKGMHTAHAYFPEAGTRPVADVDVLVRESDVDDIEDLLRKHGFEIHERQHRPAKTEWRKPGEAVLPVSLTYDHADDPIAIDVHTSLNRDFVGVQTVRLQSVFTPSASRTITEPLLALMLAVHASEGLHNLRLIRQIELALVVRTDFASNDLDWAEFEDAANVAGAWRFAYPAIELTNQLWPNTFPAVIVERSRSAATPAMRKLVGTLTPATAQRIDRMSVEERFMWAGTSAEKMRRLLYGLWPAPAGRSLKRLGEIYARRAWTVLRGRVEG